MASIKLNGTTFLTKNNSTGEIEFGPTLTTATKFPAGTPINAQTYTYDSVAAYSAHSAEYAWWSVTYNRRFSDSGLWVDMMIPAYQLPNGVWVGNALKITAGSTTVTKSRGWKNHRPGSTYGNDTSLGGFLSIFTSGEIGTTTGDITVSVISCWGGCSSAMQWTAGLNFQGGSSGPHNDARVSASAKTQGSMVIQEVTELSTITSKSTPTYLENNTQDWVD